MSDSATMQAYAGRQVEVTIERDSMEIEAPVARGVVVRGPCLTLTQALRMVELDRDVAAGKEGAFHTMLTEFVAATGIGDARVTFAEIYQEVIPAFLAGAGLRKPTPTSHGDLTT